MPERVEITGPAGERYDEILTTSALELLTALHDELADRRAGLLVARRRRQAELIEIPSRCSPRSSSSEGVAARR